MGKTYKRCPYRYYRHPKGKIKAIINGARSKAVPPDSWDDICYCKITEKYWKLAERMKAKGITEKVAIRNILIKCKKTRRSQVERATKWTWHPK